MDQRNRKLNRLPGFDYSQSGYYFITICTNERVRWFGNSKEHTIIHSALGEFAKSTFANIPKFYSSVSIDEYVVMPNHIHGIIIIHNRVGTEQCSVPTNMKLGRYGLLSKIIKSFKNTVTSFARNTKDLSAFQWQRSYYDHIIRSETSFLKIKHYIRNNPLYWETDEENI